MITEDQMPRRYRGVIEEQIDIYNQGRSITVYNSIPDTADIPIENPKHWLRIADVISVFVDMAKSTQLAAEKDDKTIAGAYQLFTGTAVRLFHEFDAPYIDVRGDGVFALFDSSQPHTALAAAVTFKTFAEEEFVPIVRKRAEVDVGCHIGIDQGTLLVRKIGLKRKNGRTDRQNEVWAGRPVNMSSKLAAKTEHGELLASDRFFKQFRSELVLKSCGCPNGEKVDLWDSIDLSDDTRFDFATAYRLRSRWCREHGREYCEAILKLDGG